MTEQNTTLNKKKIDIRQQKINKEREDNKKK